MAMRSNRRAIIQNNTFSENNVSMSVYALSGMSSIQLNDVAFSGNNFKGILLAMRSNWSATIQTNTLTGNKVCFIESSSSL